MKVVVSKIAYLIIHVSKNRTQRPPTNVDLQINSMRANPSAGRPVEDKRPWNFVRPTSLIIPDPTPLPTILLDIRIVAVAKGPRRPRFVIRPRTLCGNGFYVSMIPLREYLSLCGIYLVMHPSRTFNNLISSLD